MASRDNYKKGIKKLKILVFNSKSDVANFRSKIEDAFYSPFLPNHVECTEKNYGSIKCDVLSPEIYSSRRVVFYVHGGCFVGGSRRSYREFCSLLANKVYSRVVVPEYRLAPTHAFPCANEDIQAAFRALFTEEQIARSLEQNSSKQNTDSSDGEKLFPEIIIAADGAGSAIALSLILNLRERYRQCIKKVVLFSPWLNISKTSFARSVKKSEDDVMTQDCLSASALSYTYESNLENPMVSPFFASDESLKGFPSVYIQMGSKELLLKDAYAFKERLTSLGNDCTIAEYEKLPHLFQLDDEHFFEAHDAILDFAKQISNSAFQDEKKELRFENKPRLEQSI